MVLGGPTVPLSLALVSRCGGAWLCFPGLELWSLVPLAHKARLRSCISLIKGQQVRPPCRRATRLCS